MAFVVEHHEALELDLAPDTDLLDLWRGSLSFRKLALLVRDLPADSRTVRDVDPAMADAASWKTQDHLLALLADMFGRANFQNWKPIPRPGEKAAEDRRTAERRRLLVERSLANRRR